MNCATPLVSRLFMTSGSHVAGRKLVVVSRVHTDLGVPVTARLMLPPGWATTLVMVGGTLPHLRAPTKLYRPFLPGERRGLVAILRARFRVSLYYRFGVVGPVSCGLDGV